MAVKATPQSATAKWLAGLQGATQAITDGVNRVTVAPGASAAQAQAKWLANVQAAAAKWAANVSSVSLQSWQQSMLQVGIPRVAQGAQAKQAKFQAFMADFLPYLQAGVQRIEQMPSTTLADNINRAVAMMQYNAAYKRNG